MAHLSNFKAVLIDNKCHRWHHRRTVDRRVAAGELGKFYIMLVRREHCATLVGPLTTLAPLELVVAW